MENMTGILTKQQSLGILQETKKSMVGHIIDFYHHKHIEVKYCYDIQQF
jgi:hypothetical protein